MQTVSVRYSDAILAQVTGNSHYTTRVLHDVNAVELWILPPSGAFSLVAQLHHSYQEFQTFGHRDHHTDTYTDRLRSDGQLTRIGLQPEDFGQTIRFSHFEVFNDMFVVAFGQSSTGDSNRLVPWVQEDQCIRHCTLTHAEGPGQFLEQA